MDFGVSYVNPMYHVRLLRRLYSMRKNFEDTYEVKQFESFLYFFS